MLRAAPVTPRIPDWPMGWFWLRSEGTQSLCSVESGRIAEGARSHNPISVVKLMVGSH